MGGGSHQLDFGGAQSSLFPVMPYSLVLPIWQLLCYIAVQHIASIAGQTSYVNMTKIRPNVKMQCST